MSWLALLHCWALSPRYSRRWRRFSSSSLTSGSLRRRLTLRSRAGAHARAVPPRPFRPLAQLLELCRALRARTARGRLDAYCDAIVAELAARPWYGARPAGTPLTVI